MHLDFATFVVEEQQSAFTRQVHDAELFVGNLRLRGVAMAGRHLHLHLRAWELAGLVHAGSGNGSVALQAQVLHDLQVASHLLLHGLLLDGVDDVLFPDHVLALTQVVCVVLQVTQQLRVVERDRVRRVVHLLVLQLLQRID